MAAVEADVSSFDEQFEYSLVDAMEAAVESETLEMSWDDKLAELERRYQDRIFTYKKYTGTVSDLVACPAFALHLEVSVNEAAAWLESHDGIPDDEPEPEPEEVLSQSDESDSEDGAEIPKETVKPVNGSREKTMELRPDEPVRIAIVAVERPAVQQNTEHGVGDDFVKSTERATAKIITDASSHEIPLATIAVTDIKINDPVEAQTTKVHHNTEVDVLHLIVDEKVIEQHAPIAPPVDNDSEVHIHLSNSSGHHHEETASARDASEVSDVNEFLVPTPKRERTRVSPEHEIDILLPAVVFSENTEQQAGLPVPVAMSASEEQSVTRDTVKVAKAVQSDVFEDIAPDSLEPLGIDELAIELKSDDLPHELIEHEAAFSRLDSPIEHVLDNEIDESLEVESGVAVMEMQEVAALAALIGEQPDSTSAHSVLELCQSSVTVVSMIEVLEQAKTAEACRGAVTKVHAELTTLLLLMGYSDADSLAYRLLKQYDVKQLKKHMYAIVQALSSPERLGAYPSSHTRASLWRKCGSHVVSMLTQLVIVVN